MIEYLNPLARARAPHDCDLCGERPSTGQLQRLELEDHHDRRRRVRIAYVCDRHGDEPAAAPARPPRRQTSAGTTRQQPQCEALFGPKLDGCAGSCRYPAICPPCVFEDRGDRA